MKHVHLELNKPVPKETKNKAQKPLELVYSDKLGPFEVPTLDGSRCAITFIDEYSKHSVVKFMSKKSQASEKFKEYVAEFGTPRRLRTDNGAEYTANKFKDYCRDSRIKQEFTLPETPQQNGVAECFNRTLVEMGRSLLIQAKLPKRYWVRALSTTAHIRNLTVTAGSTQGRSPFELITGKPPSSCFWLHCISYEEKGQLKEVRFEIRESQIHRMMTKVQPTSCKNLTQKRSSELAMLSSRKAKYSPSRQRRQ